MAHSIVIHLLDEDAILGEVEEYPAPADNFIRVTNPRRMDGKELPNLRADVAEALWPVHRITFIELIPSEEETIIGFVRE